MRAIVKRFPGVLANDHVDFTVEAGEIHALLGENGAGKSTLMQVLYGLHRMDSGEILINGVSVKIDNPQDAIALGLGMVHQEFMLVQRFTVTQNVVLGAKDKGMMLDLKAESASIKALSERHQLAIDPEARVDSLPIGVQQRVEVVKLLYRNAKLLVLDEPTAVLTPAEKDRLFDVLRSLRAEGLSIIIVTHKLHEIMELTDRVTIMRDGRVVGTVVTKASSAADLARLMVGRDVNLRAEKKPVDRGDCTLRVHKLHVRDANGYEKLRGVTLDIHAGEIVGIAGVDGNGQSQLAEAILNLWPMESGQIFLSGEDITDRTVAERRSLGLGYVPADRRGVGLVSSLSIADNLILGSQRLKSRRGFLDRPAIRASARMIVTRFGVRSAGIETTAGKLSGGNLQKVILGREILRGPKALVVEQPTRGLDVAAIESIWKELLRERESGTAILLISAELEELMNLADRIAVMFNGEIVGIVDADGADTRALGEMMAGRVRITGEPQPEADSRVKSR